MPRNLTDLPLNDDPQDTDWLLGASGISPAVFQKIPVGLVKAPVSSGGGSIFVPINEPTTLTEGGLFFTDTLASNLLVTFDSPPIGTYIRWLNYSSKRVFFHGFSTVDGVTIPTDKGIFIPSGGFLEGFVNSAGNFKQLSGSYNIFYLPGLGPLDPFFENVVLFLKGDGVNNSTMILDSSPSAKAVSVFGDTKISTAQSKYGGSSILFDGNGDYLTLPSSSDWTFGTGDFTVESWVYISALTLENSVYRAVIASNYQGPSGGLALQIAGTSTSVATKLFFSNGDVLLIDANISNIVGAFSHVAISRSGTTLRAFVNGGKVAEVTNSTNFATTSSLIIGLLSLSLPYWDFNGHQDSLRVTKGVGRYVSDFNPETDTFLSI